MSHPDLTLTEPLSLEQSCAGLPDLWAPRVLARVNDQYLKAVRVQGEFPWHSHENEDELFFVLRGVLTIGRAEEDGGPVIVRPGEVFVVPRGVRHKTSAEEETWLALLETVTTQHTALTRSTEEQLGTSISGRD